MAVNYDSSRISCGVLAKEVAYFATVVSYRSKMYITLATGVIEPDRRPNLTGFKKFKITSTNLIKLFGHFSL